MMPYFVGIGLGSLIALALLWSYGACVSGAEADQLMEEWTSDD